MNTTYNTKTKRLTAELAVAATAVMAPALLFAGAGTANADDPCYDGSLAGSYYCSPASGAGISSQTPEPVFQPAERERLRGMNPAVDETPADAAGTSFGRRGPEDEQEYMAWLESVMATGPPDDDPYNAEREAIDIIAELLGGRIVAA